MVLLKLDAFSLYGKKVADALRASESALNEQCRCGPGESCSVEIAELPGRRFEAVVVRPRPVVETHGWASNTSVSGMYRLLFERRADAKRIRDALVTMVGAPADEDENDGVPATEPDVLNVVVVDSDTLKKARTLIAGCEACSPYAAIPLDSILDRVTGKDPSSTRYVVAEGSARCPRCRRSIGEDTLVEFEPELGGAY